MISSFKRILVLAGMQAKICRSLVRFWVAVALLSVIVLIGYIQSCVWQTLNASYSPSFSLAEPKYLLSNVDVLVFLAFQLIAVVLTFDIRPFHDRNRIQSVIETRQLTNFEYLFGSTIGVSILLYLVIVGNIVIIEGLGAISYFTNSAWGDFLNPTSVFNLLVVDAFPSLFFWSSLALGLTSLLRSGFAAVLISVILLLTFYVGSLVVPFSWLDIVTPSSNFTAYTSELVPNFAPLEVIGMRVLTVVGSLGFLAFAAFTLDRRDARIGIVNLPLGLGTAVLSVVGVGMLATALVTSYYRPQEWSEIHAAFDQNVKLDTHEIRGSVEIDPGHLLALDLTYEFQVTEEHQLPHLAFTFNPSMSINQITLNGREVEHDFANGLLIVHTEVPLLPNETQKLRFNAEGIPDPAFAYLDSPTDYFTNRSIPRRAAQLFGKDGSIFSTKYVALLPGMYWYPVPGSQSLVRSLAQEIDFFRTSLEISITNPNWLLVGTDIVQDENVSTKFSLSPKVQISDLALFGTDFVKHSMTQANITFNLYLHTSHQKNLGKFDFEDERVREAIDEIFVPFAEAGLHYPFNELSFVEIPNRLRTLTGGFKPESAQVLPGMFLMKERGFPTAHFDTRIKRIQNWEEDPENWEYRKYRALADYFGDAIGTDNLWSSFAKVFWSHSTSAKGDDALVLNDLMLSVVTHLSEAPSLWFSPYATYQIADFTHIFLPAIEWAVDEGGGGDLTNWARDLAQQYLNRHSIWEAMELKSLLELPTEDSHQSDFEFMLAKNRLIARVLVQTNDDDTILAWLSTVRKEYQGTSFTLSELLHHAEQAELEIHPYLNSWLHGNELPGYLVSELTHRRLRDDEEGNPRYESSFYVNNPSNTAGVFWAAYPPEQGRRWPRTPTVIVEGKSTVRINVVTSYEIDYIHIFPNLSLNRSEFGVARGPAVIWDDTETQDEPRPLFEIADWKPPQPGIVVDDLDAGFAVAQPSVTGGASSLGPLDWFRIPQLQADIDNGLPARSSYAYRTRSGTWGRISDDNSYGHFRRTATVTRYSPEIHQVAFSTALPDTTRWKLEYFFNTHWFRRNSRDGVYHLEIEHAEAIETRGLSFKNSIYGWNFVDEFELLQGEVSVRVISASKDTPWLYADAIRWVPVHENRNGLFDSGGGGGS